MLKEQLDVIFSYRGGWLTFRLGDVILPRAFSKPGPTSKANLKEPKGIGSYPRCFSIDAKFSNLLVRPVYLLSPAQVAALRRAGV